MKKVYIGLNVHKETIVIGVAKDDRVFIHGKCSSYIQRFLKALRGLLNRPSGLTLARHLKRIGYEVEVIAP